MEFFINGAELLLNSVNSANSGNLINHWSMNWAQFKDPVSHMCFVWCCSGILVSHTRGSRFKSLNCSGEYFCHWIQWKHLEKRQYFTTIYEKFQPLSPFLYILWVAQYMLNFCTPCICTVKWGCIRMLHRMFSCKFINTMYFCTLKPMISNKAVFSFRDSTQRDGFSSGCSCGTISAAWSTTVSWVSCSPV